MRIAISAGSRTARPAGVVQVMELCDRRIAGLEHLEIELCSNRLLFDRADALEKAIHLRAPGPEIVRCGAAALRQARERTLEGVRVHVRHPGNERPLHALGVLRRRKGDVDRAERAVGPDVEHDVPRPAGRQQRVAREEFHGGFVGSAASSLDGLLCVIMPCAAPGRLRSLRTGHEASSR
jgi:hypothetical protein